MHIITRSEELAQICEEFRTASYIAVDTEFMRETTFWPKLCLIQLATPDRAVIVDPLADGGIDLAPLFPLFADGRIVKIFHAARQDIEIFHNLCGAIPTPVFDTQVAAMVCGFGDSIAYDQLVLRTTGAKIDKTSRFTQWDKRPLSERQLEYALADVTHLRDVYTYLRSALIEQSRTEWVAEEMAILTSPETYDLEPRNAWKRLKMKAKTPLDLAILQDVAALRETEARERDVPRGRVLKDDAIYDIAAQKPQSAEALDRLRSLPKGLGRSRFGARLTETVRKAVEAPPNTWPALPKRRQNHEGFNASVELLKVLLKLTAERHGVAAKIIATVDDLEAIAGADDADVPALKGWRREIFGEAALRMKRGELAITFTGRRLKTIECPTEQV